MSRSVLRVPEEEVRYKTVDKLAGTITDGEEYTEHVNIAAEVTYIYNNLQHKATDIVSVGNPLLYIPGVSAATISGGEFNITEGINSTRISCTAALQYEGPSASVSIGGDIVGVDFSFSGKTITTRAKTFAITVSMEDI